MMRFIPCTLSLSLLFIPVMGTAQTDELTEIIVQAFPPVSQVSPVLKPHLRSKPDAAELLKSAPGANLNSNGPITGIAQYRGLYGNRVSVVLDRAPALTGGPNAMDTPLSYAPVALLKSLSVHRGVVPVSVAQETLGGHIEAHLDRGDFANGQALQISGFANSHYSDNGNQSDSNLRLVASNQQHKFALLASHGEGDDLQSAHNLRLTGTQFQRDRFDLSYAWQSADSAAALFVGRLDTVNSGTPALAMDISSIESDLAGFNLYTHIKDIRLSANMAWANIDHAMDNHSLRQPPMMTMSYRTNQASADNLSWTLKADIPVYVIGINQQRLTLGTDGNLSNHHSIISNPENSLFELTHFNAVERDTLGLFAELEGSLDKEWNYMAGVRFNRVSLQAGTVNSSGMMGMMANLTDSLATQFNHADRNPVHHSTDLVVKLSRTVTPATSINIDLGIKNRAPSYQEVFVWMPLPITAGLADGRSYLGNLSLDHETVKEIGLGFDHQQGNFKISPQLFYRHIDNYIQGTPTTNMTANRVSNMMSGAAALTYSNVDAKIYGIDASWHYLINDHWSMDGLFSYVRGKRTDIRDNLYRVAPANARLSLHYRPRGLAGRLQLTLESQLYARQNKVANFNNESATAGYAVSNLISQWSIDDNMQIKAGISNLFHRNYIEHLSGSNRNAGSDIALACGLPGAGRNIHISLQINW